MVTKDPSEEHWPTLRQLRPPDVPVVMSSEAWEAYEVPASPYFVFVDGASGTIHGEGVGETWEQVVSLLRDALAESEGPPASRGTGELTRPPMVGSMPAARGGEGRALRADVELAAAGIGPDHPSLYDAGDPRVVS